MRGQADGTDLCVPPASLTPTNAGLALLPRGGRGRTVPRPGPWSWWRAGGPDARRRATGNRTGGRGLRVRDVAIRSQTRGGIDLRSTNTLSIRSGETHLSAVVKTTKRQKMATRCGCSLASSTSTAAPAAARLASCGSASCRRAAASKIPVTPKTRREGRHRQFGTALTYDATKSPGAPRAPTTRGGRP